MLNHLPRRILAALFAALIVAGCPVTANLGGESGTYASLRVENDSPIPLTGLYISPTTSESWGANQLSSAIPGYGSRIVRNIPPGHYDLRAVDQNGAAATAWNVSLRGGTTAVWTVHDKKACSILDTALSEDECYRVLPEEKGPAKAG